MHGSWDKAVFLSNLKLHSLLCIAFYLTLDIHSCASTLSFCHNQVQLTIDHLKFIHFHLNHQKYRIPQRDLNLTFALIQIHLVTL